MAMTMDYWDNLGNSIIKLADIIVNDSIIFQGRPLGTMEYLCQVAASGEEDGQAMSLITLVCVLDTTVNLTDEMIERALHGLQKHHPLLQMCIEERNGRLHYVLMKDETKLNFKVIEESDWRKVTEEVMQEPYDWRNGPLWSCRLGALYKCNSSKVMHGNSM